MSKRDDNSNAQDSNAKNDGQSGSAGGDANNVKITGNGVTVIHGDHHGAISHTFGRK